MGSDRRRLDHYAVADDDRGVRPSRSNRSRALTGRLARMNFGLSPATSAVPFAKATFERPIRAWTTPPRRERHSVAREGGRIMNNVAPLREQIATKLYSAVLSDALDA